MMEDWVGADLIGRVEKSTPISHGLAMHVYDEFMPFVCADESKNPFEQTQHSLECTTLGQRTEMNRK